MRGVFSDSVVWRTAWRRGRVGWHPLLESFGAMWRPRFETQRRVQRLFFLQIFTSLCLARICTTGPDHLKRLNGSVQITEPGDSSEYLDFVASTVVSTKH